MKDEKLRKVFIPLLFVVLMISMVASTAIGSVYIPFGKVVSIILSKIPLIGDHMPTYTGSDAVIILLMRLPRVLFGVIAGISLAVSGSSMQGLFKNPMASPFILGVSAGGALGASLALLFNMGYYALPIMAFLFAMMTAFVVFGLGRVGGKTDISTLLLAGLAMNFLMSALTSYVMYLGSPEDRLGIVAWMWGSLNGTVWRELILVSPIVLLGCVLVYGYSRELNVMQMGEESAMQLGIEVERTKIVQLITASLLAAAVIAFTGIIGFVGLIIPHSARLIVGPDHKKLIPSAGLLGGIFLVFCDTLSRLGGEIWVGIITGLFGAPFFIYLLVRNRGETGW